MKACLLSKHAFIAVLLCLVITAPVRAAESTPGDREQCEKNLNAIFKAIQSYRSEKKDMPPWLSDLVPKYIKDPNTLICPI